MELVHFTSPPTIQYKSRNFDRLAEIFFFDLYSDFDSYIKFLRAKNLSQE